MSEKESLWYKFILSYHILLNCFCPQQPWNFQFWNQNLRKTRFPKIKTATANLEHVEYLELSLFDLHYLFIFSTRVFIKAIVSARDLTFQVRQDLCHSQTSKTFSRIFLWTCFLYLTRILTKAACILHVLLCILHHIFKNPSI